MSSPRTAGSCTRARPRTPACSGAYAAAAAISASSPGSSSSSIDSARSSMPARSSTRPRPPRPLARVSEVGRETPRTRSPRVVNLRTAPPLPVILEGSARREGRCVDRHLSRPGRRRWGRSSAGFRAVAEPIADLLGPMPYQDDPDPDRPAVGEGDLRLLQGDKPGAARRRADRAALRTPSRRARPAMRIHVHQMGGAVARVADDATAFAERSMPFVRRGHGLARPGRGHRPHGLVAHGDRRGVRRIDRPCLRQLPRRRGTRRGRHMATKHMPGWSSLKNRYDPTNVFRPQPKPRACVSGYLKTWWPATGAGVTPGAVARTRRRRCGARGAVSAAPPARRRAAGPGAGWLQLGHAVAHHQFGESRIHLGPPQSMIGGAKLARIVQ